MQPVPGSLRQHQRYSRSTQTILCRGRIKNVPMGEDRFLSNIKTINKSDLKINRENLLGFCPC